MPTDEPLRRVNCATCHGTGKTLDDLNQEPTCPTCDGRAWYYA